MIKKIMPGFLLLIVAVIAAIAGYVFHVQAERPATQPSLTSVVTDAEYQKASRAAASWIASLYAQHLLPSVSAAVGVNGQLVWQGVIGYADLNNLMPAGTDTRYRIGSISKAMTAVVALRMQEQGLLNIDQTFSHYVKDFPATHEQITLKQLLSHQAGIRHYVNDVTENFNRTEYANTRAAAAIVGQDALLFPPGQGFHYSTYGYTLLSLAMELAAARPFAELMEDELFSPSGLRSTQLNKVKHAASSELSVPVWQCAL